MVIIAIQLFIVSNPGCMDPTQTRFITGTARETRQRDKSLLGDMHSDNDYELSMMSLHHTDWVISSITLAVFLAIVCAILACSLVLLKMYHVKVGMNRDLSIFLLICSLV